jgi:thiol-disulfide isomerase/thioredoxin
LSTKSFEEQLNTEKRMFVLFYASWCPHSRRFLPIYEKCTKKISTPCFSVVIDNREDLCDKYQIQYYPTVVLFVGGKVSKRLDAKPGEGLSEQELTELLNAS